MEDQVKCPKCGSTQISADKKGFSGVKAVAGAVVAGPLGIAAGTIGSNKVKITCLKCGHTFSPGDKPVNLLSNESDNSPLLGCLLAFIVIAIVIGIIVFAAFS